MKLTVRTRLVLTVVLAALLPVILIGLFTVYNGAEAGAGNQWGALVLIAVVSAGVAVGAGILLAHSITAPLKSLQEGVDVISTGDLNRKFVLDRDDEIGDLSADVDRMRRYLKYRMIELEKLFKIGQAISSELNFKQLLNIILNTIIDELNADSGSVMLLDEEENYLSIAVARHLPEDIINNTRVFLGEGIVGRVAQTGERLMIEDVDNSPEFKALKREGVTKGGSMLSAALTVTDKTLETDKILGVINISKGEVGAFKSHDLEFFSALANQAAIAISNAKLYRLATTDGMTKLYLKRFFQHKLDEEIIRSKRYKKPVSVIMMDIDHFKNFNDTYGHQVGDQVLMDVASIVEDTVRTIDIVARYGGEEFVVVCPEMDAGNALHPAERIRSAIQYHDFRVKGEKVPITISLGVASYPEDAVERSELIKRADEALYASKEQGRNRVTCYRQIDELGLEIPSSQKEG